MILILTILGCLVPTTPFSSPTPPIPMKKGQCDRLTLLDTLHIGGLYTSAAMSADALFLADQDRIDVIDRDTKSTMSISPVGETHDIVFTDGHLWIAAGTGGIQRWTPGEPLTLTSQWTVGSDIVDIVVATNTLWAADKTGRVWSLPLNAQPSAVAASLVVDGWPSRVTAWGNGVLVHGDGGPLEAVTALGNGTLVTTDSSSVRAYTQIVTDGDIAYSALLNRVERTGTDPSASLVLPFDIVSITAVEEGLIIIGDSSEVRFWPIDDFDAHHMLSSDSLGFDATGVVVDEENYLFYGPTAARWYTKHGAQLTQIWRRDKVAGSITALANHANMIAVGTARPDGRGEILLLERQEDTLVLLRKLSTSAVSDLVIYGQRVLATTATDGVVAVDLSIPSPQWITQSVALAGEELMSLTHTADGQLVVLSRQRGLVWLGGNPSRYEEQGNQSFYGFQSPISIVGTRHGIAVGYQEIGAIDLFTKPNTPPMTTLLAGSLADNTAHNHGRLREVNGEIWALSPLLGLQHVDTTRGILSTTIQVSDGAWDLAGNDLISVAALGRAGVGIIGSVGNSAYTLGSHCDMSGVVTRVAVDDDYIIAATWGTLSLLSPRQNPTNPLPPRE